MLDKKMHLDTIKKVKKFISKKDFEGLKEYIDNREIEIKFYDENRSSDYVEELVDKLL